MTDYETELQALGQAPAPVLKFKRLPHGDGLPLPAYATEGAAGMDICAADYVELGTHPTLVYTGFAVEVPEGWELQVRPRSGLSLTGVRVCNAPGTIDSDYRGEIKIIMAATKSARINRRDRVAQLVLAPVHRLPVIEVEELSDTVRGEGGFGSTGK